MLQLLASQWEPYAHCAWCDSNFHVPLPMFSMTHRHTLLVLGCSEGLDKCLHRSTHVSYASHWPKSHQVGGEDSPERRACQSVFPTTPPTGCPDPPLLLATPRMMEPAHSANRSKLTISFFGRTAPSQNGVPQKKTPVNPGGESVANHWQISGKSLANHWQTTGNSVVPICHRFPTDFPPIRHRITLGFKMHPIAAFLSMPNERGVIPGGTTSRGFYDHSERGYPVFLNLSTQQIPDVVRCDEKMLEAKRTALPLLNAILKGIQKQLW